MKNTASDIKQHLFEHPLTAGLIIFSVMSTLLLSTSPPAHSLPQDGMTHQRVAPQVQLNTDARKFVSIKDSAANPKSSKE